MNFLNSKQNEAVHHVSSPLLIIAGAGSGKTRVITHKISWLIDKQNISPDKIVAVTFTNKASSEMSKRIGEMIGEQVAKNIQISTFHRLGLEIIKLSLDEIGLRAGFSIFDNSDSEKVIQDLSQNIMDKDTISNLQRKISGWKNSGLSTNNPPSSVIASDWEVYIKYEEMLLLYNAIDFDDLLLKPLFLLSNNLGVLETWRKKIDYLLVDEYQDTNSVQYEIVRMLVGNRNCLTVVGDDDQSIYAWRGAEQENLFKLEQDFPSLKIIKLEQNYRSTGRILKAANHLISNNKHLFEKSLWSSLGYGDAIRVINCKNEIHESEKIIADLLYQKLSRGLAFEDFAILYRSNHQARLFEQSLRSKGIAYQLSGGRSFFDYSEIKDIMSYLKIMINPDDDASFLRIINTPRRGIGKSTIDKIAMFAKEKKSRLCFSAFEISEEYLGKRSYSNLRVFMEWLEKFQYYSETADPLELIGEIIADVNYQEWLEGQCETEELAQKKLKNIDDLLSWVKNIQDKKNNCLLKDIVNHMTLMDILENKDEENVAGVSLMTLHASKGLEYNHIYLVGVEEDILPHKNSIDSSLEEERRLAYVGITRARETLTLSMASTRRRYGETNNCSPSRFIAELPEEDLVYLGEGIEVTEDEQKDINRTHLANLKSMFGKKD